MLDLWPSQFAGIGGVEEAIRAGHRRICLTSPTGGGKTRIACELIRIWLQEGLAVALYTNRKFLLEQLSGVLSTAGLVHGIRASGYQSSDHLALQLASLQTENTRRRRANVQAGEWQLHPADRVLVDEAHLNTGKSVQGILARHLEEGAVYVGLTATPIGLLHLYDRLVVAGRNSELRACGALVRCLHYGPDEPDLRRLHGLREGEDLSEAQQDEAMGPRPQLWGRIWEWYNRLNPHRLPTIVFAPSVGGSLWLAEQFSARGVRAAHIDGEDIWLDGQLRKSSRELRQEVLSGSQSGRVPVITNRFVLREGIDAPWLAHGILATVFGSLQSYLQSGGRLLRNYPGLQTVIIQDHGGNWHRHGSLNADRDWHLDDRPNAVSGMRAQRLRDGQEPEPFRCRLCALILVAGRCPGCGWEPTGKRSRPVVTAAGELIEVEGRIYRPRQLCQKRNGPQLWEKMYFRSRKGKGSRTFAAAMALFAKENNWRWPDPSWPYMPTDPADVYTLVADVPQDRLVPKRESAHA